MSSSTAELIVRVRNARQAKRDVDDVSSSIRGMATATTFASAAGKEMSGSFGSATAAVKTGAERSAFAIGILGAAGAKWGLQFDAQVESSRERFRLFTNDVDGLTKAVSAIDQTSQFNFGDLSDAAAMLGNSNIRDIPRVLQGAANAAAASGRGTQALQSIVIALSQIQQKGRLSQEELNQLAEAGAPQVMNTIQRAYGLTAKQLGNIGGQGLDATKALQALTAEWTSGRMAQAALRQTKTLGGQWDLFTGNMQKLSGAATKGLSDGLEHDVLPAANRAVGEITDILGQKGLSDEQKLRQARDAIRRELGPVAQDIIADIRRADLADKLDHEFELAMDKMSATAVTNAPHIVGTFVDAWLGAGPWAKLISGVWFAKKLGLTAGTIAALKQLRAGGGKSSTANTIANALGGRGAVPERPLFVFDVSSGKSTSGLVDDVKKAAPVVGSVALRAAALAPEGATAAALAVPVAAAFFDTKPKATQPAGRTVGQVVNGHDTYLGPLRRSTTPQPLPARSRPIILHHTTVVTLPNGKVLATAVDDAVADEKARR